MLNTMSVTWRMAQDPLGPGHGKFLKLGELREWSASAQSEYALCLFIDTKRILYMSFAAARVPPSVGDRVGRIGIQILGPV